MHYTYDPAKINEDNHHRMRLELGDTEVSGGANTCALSDEEYAAYIKRATEKKNPWQAAKLMCLRAIVMRFAMSVDLNAGGINLSLSARYDRYKALLDEEEKKSAMPTFISPFEKAADGGHYFYAGMHDNPRG